MCGNKFQCLVGPQVGWSTKCKHAQDTKRHAFCFPHVRRLCRNITIHVYPLKKNHEDYPNPSFGFVIKDGARSKASCQETTQTLEWIKDSENTLTWNGSVWEWKWCILKAKTLKLLSHFGIWGFQSNGRVPNLWIES